MKRERQNTRGFVMQILSQRSKFSLIGALFVCVNAYAQISNNHVTYTLVDVEGDMIGSSQGEAEKGMFFRQERRDGSHTDFRIPEFDTMVRKHDFEFQLAFDSLISSPQGDYFVVEAMRSIAMNPAEDVDYRRHPLWWKYRCGHAVNLTYLVGVVKNKIKIVKKYPAQCISETRTFNRDGQLGFEVKGYGNDDSGHSVLYLLQKDGSFIRKVNGLYKAEP